MNLTNFLTEVCTYLQYSSIGTVAVDIFRNTMPASPINCVAVYASGGPRSVDDPLVRPTLQVLIRNSDSSSGRTKTDSVFSVLDDKWNFLTTFQGRCIADHQPGPNYRDQDNNVIYTLNFNCTFKEL